MSGPTPGASGAMLVARGLAKSYGATRALRGVSFELRAGRVYGLIGVNGSGKSTLMKIMAGAERASSGDMLFAGSSYRPRNVMHASRLGIGIVPQELPIVRDISVADNVLIGRWPTRLGTLRPAAARRAAAAAMDEVGTRVDVTMRAGDLKLGEQQLTVIARTLARRPRLVLLDEPTSALSGAEVIRLRDVVRDIAAQGRTVLIVSQRLDDVFSVCDHIMVLRNGELLASAPTGQLSADRAIELMLHGQAHRDPHPGPAGPPATGRPPGPGSALSMTGVRLAGRATELDLEVASGEVVGLAGLPDSGSSELLRTLFGVAPATAHEIRLFGRPYRPSDPANAIRAGLAYVTGDRQAEGLVPDATVATNIAMVANRSARGGPWRLARGRRAALAQIAALQIRPGDPDVPVGALSGGNQQKVLLARWSLAAPRLWLLDDATRGVDIGARRDIHDVIRGGVRKGGAAALVVSSDLLELFEMCDRIAVFRFGAVVAQVAVRDTSAGEIEALSTGTSVGASTGTPVRES